MKRSAEDHAFGGVAKRLAGNTPPPPRTRHAFKVLCTDNLTLQLLGVRGSNKDWIQQHTGTKFVFSNKGDYFPNTKFRVLGIYSDDAANIMAALEQVVPVLVQSADEEAKHPAQAGSELLGKEKGEYIFRIAIAKKTSATLIGPGGSNIQRLRSLAKIFVENETVADHQMVRVIAQRDNILPCLARINEFVQQGAGTEEYASWAMLVNFSDVAPEAQGTWASAPSTSSSSSSRVTVTVTTPPAPVPAAGKPASTNSWTPASRHPAAAGASPPSNGQASSLPPQRRPGAGSPGAPGAPVVVPPPVRRGAGQSPGQPPGQPPGRPVSPGPPPSGTPAAAAGAAASAAAGDEEAIDATVDRLAEAVGVMPGGTAQMQYSITCELLSQRVDFLAECTEYLDFIKETTGTTVDLPQDDEDSGRSPLRAISFVGPLLNIYVAHLLLMKKVKEHELTEVTEVAAEAAAAEPDDTPVDGAADAGEPEEALPLDTELAEEAEVPEVDVQDSEEPPAEAELEAEVEMEAAADVLLEGVDSAEDVRAEEGKEEEEQEVVEPEEDLAQKIEELKVQIEEKQSHLSDIQGQIKELQSQASEAFSQLKAFRSELADVEARKAAKEGGAPPAAAVPGRSAGAGRGAPLPVAPPAGRLAKGSGRGKGAGWHRGKW